MDSLDSQKNNTIKEIDRCTSINLTDQGAATLASAMVYFSDVIRYGIDKFSR